MHCYTLWVFFSPCFMDIMRKNSGGFDFNNECYFFYISVESHLLKMPTGRCHFLSH